jgi:hypothetical protein
MKTDQKLFFVAAGLIALIVLAATYFLFSPAPATQGSTPISTTADTLRPKRGFSIESSVTGVKSYVTDGNSKAPAKAGQANEPQKYSSFARKPQWEKDILLLVNRLDMTDMSKANQLLSRMNNLPPEAKVVALDYATQLIPDDKYVSLRPWLFQLASSQPLQETVLLDALTRDDNLRMETLIELLRLPNYAGKEEVRQILKDFLDEEYTEDLNELPKRVKSFLAKNGEA